MRREAARSFSCELLICIIIFNLRATITSVHTTELLMILKSTPRVIVVTFGFYVSDIKLFALWNVSKCVSLAFLVSELTWWICSHTLQILIMGHNTKLQSDSQSDRCKHGNTAETLHLPHKHWTVMLRLILTIYGWTLVCWGRDMRRIHAPHSQVDLGIYKRNLRTGTSLQGFINLNIFRGKLKDRFDECTI